MLKLGMITYRLGLRAESFYMTTKELKSYLEELLLEDNENLTSERFNIYINGIFEELKFCKITYKSIEEVSLHEFDTRYGYVLLVRVIYSGDFEHNFEVFGSPRRIYYK